MEYGVTELKSTAIWLWDNQEGGIKKKSIKTMTEQE